jgi:hypothetical protein
MQIGTTTTFPTPTGPGRAFFLEDEPRLIEQLRAFGLIEASGEGGWQLSAAHEIGPSAFAGGNVEPKPTRSVILPWELRKP